MLLRMAAHHRQGNEGSHWQQAHTSRTHDMWVTGQCKVVTPDVRTLILHTQKWRFTNLLRNSLWLSPLWRAMFELRPKWWEEASSCDNLDIKHSRDKKQLEQRSWGRHKFGAKIHGSVCLDFSEWERWWLDSWQEQGQKSYHTGHWLSTITAYQKRRYFTPRDYDAVSLGEAFVLLFLLLLFQVLQTILITSENH